jgi:predicted transcriptional regulator
MPEKTTTVSVKLPQTQLKALDRKAKASDRSRAAEIRVAINAHLAKP